MSKKLRRRSGRHRYLSSRSHCANTKRIPWSCDKIWRTSALLLLRSLPTITAGITGFLIFRLLFLPQYDEDFRRRTQAQILENRLDHLDREIAAKEALLREIDQQNAARHRRMELLLERSNDIISIEHERKHEGGPDGGDVDELVLDETNAVSVSSATKNETFFFFFFSSAQRVVCMVLFVVCSGRPSLLCKPDCPRVRSASTRSRLVLKS